ncbi:MAG: hypothetical protein NT150_09480 [Bacteroidetes bacterium]|nr:hypothetical protein [Bacteroidota bacterium]
MLSLKKYTVVLLAFLWLFPAVIFAHFSAGNSSARFVQNKGQWPAQVLFGVNLNYGMIFIENDGLTFNVVDPSIIHQHHEFTHNSAPNPGNNIPSHSFKIVFDGAQTSQAEGKLAYSDYVNYFIGNDSSKWASAVPVFAEVFLYNIYKGIDLHLYESNGHFKYDFIVNAGANPNQLKMKTLFSLHQLVILLKRLH